MLLRGEFVSSASFTNCPSVCLSGLTNCLSVCLVLRGRGFAGRRTVEGGGAVM